MNRKLVTNALAGTLAGTLALLGCASAQVNTNYDPALSFAGFRTFAFMEAGSTAAGPSGVSNPLVGREIEEAIRDALVSRGFTETSTPAFRVAYQAAVDEKLDVETFTNYYGYRRRGVWIEETEVREYAEGTLILDIIDAATNDLAWRGTAHSEVSDLRDPERRRRTLETAVQQILDQFPPSS